MEDFICINFLDLCNDSYTTFEAIQVVVISTAFWGCSAIIIVSLWITLLINIIPSKQKKENTDIEISQDHSERPKTNVCIRLNSN